MKWVCALLLLIAALLAWDGRPPAMIRFAGKAHEPRLDSDVSRLSRAQGISLQIFQNPVQTTKPIATAGLSKILQIHLGIPP